MWPNSRISDEEINRFLDGELSPSQRSDLQARLRRSRNGPPRCLRTRSAWRLCAVLNRVERFHRARPWRKQDSWNECSAARSW
jgi:hypothetical protein